MCKKESKRTKGNQYCNKKMVVVASDEVEVTDLVLQRGQCLLGFL